MSIEENKEIVRRYQDIYNRERDLLLEFLPDDESDDQCRQLIHSQ